MLRKDNIRVIEHGRQRWQNYTNLWSVIQGRECHVSRSFLNQLTENKIAINVLNTIIIFGVTVTKKCA